MRSFNRIIALRRSVKFTLGHKIYALIGCGAIGLLVATLFTLNEMSDGLRHQKQIELKHLAEIALGVAKEEYEAARKGAQSDAEARSKAAARIATMRYGNNDYFWINDMHPRMVMHPTNPKLDGTDLTGNKDPNGKALFVEFVDVVKRQGSGIVAYEWPKPGADKPQPKLSYVTGFAPWGWVIGTGIYIDDLQRQTWDATRNALIVAAMALLVTALLSFVVARRMSRAITAVTAMMERLAAGEIDFELRAMVRRDEIGDMARVLGVFQSNAQENRRLIDEQREAERRAAEEKRAAAERETAQQRAGEENAAAERKSAMHKLAGDFEAAIGSIIDTVSSASTELEAAATALTKSADTTQRLSGVVASASEQATANVQSVASAAEEMAGSINEISRQVQESSRVAGEAVRQAGKTDARVNELSHAASRIGDVVKLITAIAEQTNLLALNATIEAARAGEAGKGFAVVAQEVKALAAQTAKATDEISSQITGMQTATQESVTAIKEIGGTIGRVSEIAAAIAAAVEEQGAATQEISRNVQQAAQGTAQVASNITDVNRGAGETGSASAQVLSSAQSLASESSRLKSEVDKFLRTVRAA